MITLQIPTSTDGEKSRYSPLTSHSIPGHVSQPTPVLVSAPQLDDQPGLFYSPLRHLQKKKHETKQKQPPRNADLLAINAGTFVKVAEKVGGVENSLQLPRKGSTKETYSCLICFVIKANELEEAMPVPGLK